MLVIDVHTQSHLGMGPKVPVFQFGAGTFSGREGFRLFKMDIFSEDGVP